MVTKQQLEQLRAERRKPQTRLEYNIDGPVHTEVISANERAREREIKLGEQAMRDALRDMRYEQAMSKNHGFAKAHFNNHKKDMKP